MKSHYGLVTLGFALAIGACKKVADRSTDTVAAAVSVQTKLSLSGADLIKACRDTAARAEPAVHWAADTSLTADLNYDGAPELVVWGNEGDSLFVFAVVECAASRPGRVWTFPLRAFEVFGTTNLDIALTDPAPGESYLAENCVAADTTSECQHLRKIDPILEEAYARGGRGISVGVVDQDHAYFYWDPEQHGFVSWRP